MSEIQHTSRAHARLNASSSHRWMMCPPSVKLSEQFEDKPSTYAEEGSFLHELCELKLHRYLGDMAMEAVETQYAEHRDSEFYSDEAESVTDEYVAFCIETIEAVRSSCHDPLIMVEHRLDYSEYVPEGFGTEYIKSKETSDNWQFVDVYTDKGITGVVFVPRRTLLS